MKKTTSFWLFTIAMVMLAMSVLARRSDSQDVQSKAQLSPGQQGIGHIDVTLCTGRIRQNCQHAAPASTGSKGETSSVVARQGKAIREAWITPTGDFSSLSAFDLIEVNGSSDGTINFILRAAGQAKDVTLPARVYFVFEQ